MAINSITVQITDQRIVDGWVAAAIKNNTTTDALIKEFVDHQGRVYADLNRVGLLTSGAFIRRFTGQEYAAILTAAHQYPEVEALVDELSNQTVFALDDPRLEPGLHQLVAAGLLAPERVPQLLAYDRPDPSAPVASDQPGPSAPAAP
jgi:hypothetical protein